MFSFFKKLFSAKTVDTISAETDPMKKFLIVGLGNIGPKYANTRHNIGFKVVDFYAEKNSLSWETAKLGDVTSHKVKGRTLIFLKPSTYMNLSGKAVNYWLEKEKVPLENMLVITDDLNLAFGTIRIKTKGSDGGHNGLKGYTEYAANHQLQPFPFRDKRCFLERKTSGLRVGRMGSRRGKTTARAAGVKLQDYRILCPRGDEYYDEHI